MNINDKLIFIKSKNSVLQKFLKTKKKKKRTSNKIKSNPYLINLIVKSTNSVKPFYFTIVGSSWRTKSGIQHSAGNLWGWRPYRAEIWEKFRLYAPTRSMLLRLRIFILRVVYEKQRYDLSSINSIPLCFPFGLWFISISVRARGFFRFVQLDRFPRNRAT